MRADEDENGLTFVGTAAVFEKRTWIGPKKWGFWEQVASGAFAKTLADNADVRFLYEHDPSTVMARTAAGNLRLVESKKGLETEADLDPEDRDVQRLVPKLRSGNVNQMSFAFEVVKDSWEELEEGDELRTLEEVRLWDVSAVTYPAYEDTSAALRALTFDALSARLGLSTTKRTRLVDDLLRGEADPDVVPVLRDASRTLASLATELEPAETTRADGSQPAETTGAPLTDLRRRRLELVGRSLD